MMIIHNNHTFKFVLLLLLCRDIMAYNKDRYILILDVFILISNTEDSSRRRIHTEDSIRTNVLTIERYINTNMPYHITTFVFVMYWRVVLSSYYRWVWSPAASLRSSFLFLRFNRLFLSAVMQMGERSSVALRRRPVAVKSPAAHRALQCTSSGCA